MAGVKRQRDKTRVRVYFGFAASRELKKSEASVRTFRFAENEAFIRILGFQ
jgi:hypothetical protein